MMRDWPGRREMCWVIWRKMCCVFKLMRFQSLCGRKKRIPLGMTVSLGVDADCHGELHWARMSKHAPLSMDLSFPSVLQLTSSALLCLSLFSFLSPSLLPPIILWVLCPFSLVFSTPSPSFWVGEGHGLCLSYLNFHFPKECVRHAHSCTYTHANAHTLIQKAELLSCTDHKKIKIQKKICWGWQLYPSRD